MTYNEAIQYLYDALPMYQRVGASAYKADLSNSHKLDTYFNIPHHLFRSVHVAGTNGKGSVSHMLASVFQHAGYKTGLYTSPHLLDFRERIKVNGRMVSKDFVTEFVKNNLSYFKHLKPSFFEITVFMAFCFFAKQKVDIAIIETGLGGRLDSTNILKPIASVITNIGLDHTNFLGNTLEKIALEKAGIIKENTPVIIGETQPETTPVFQSVAMKTDSKISFADFRYKVQYRMQVSDHTIEYHLTNGQTIKTDLKGSYQAKNVCTALETLDVICNILPVTRNAVEKGFENIVKTTGLLGRWQEISCNPLVICDTAHNKEGINEVVRQIQNTAYKHLHLILGFVDDKNIEELLQLFPVHATFYLTECSVPRSTKLTVLENISTKLQLEARLFENVKDAYITAKSNADSQDMIFIGGSTFVAADILSFQKK